MTIRADVIEAIGRPHAELDGVLSRALGLLQPVFRGEPIGVP